MSEKSIVIIGAGIVGACTALALQKEGHRVTLIDRSEPCAGASFGNAGAVVNASSAPTAMPGIAIDAIRMLAKPLPPLSIRPAYFPRILPWLVRFVLESRQSRVQQHARNLHALTSRANSSWQRLIDGSGLDPLLQTGGWLKVYETDESFAGTRRTRALLDDIGVPYEILSAGDIRDLEPNLAPIYRHGFFQRDSLRVVNPQRMVRGMVDLFVGRGGHYRQFDVTTIRAKGDTVELEGATGRLQPDVAVIATGAWSKPLARQLGDTVPLDTERGYHLMLPADSASLLSRPVVNGDHSFVLSPMETGIRMTSQIEFAGVDAAPDYRRVRSLVPAAKRMLPAVEPVEASVWMGCRPSLPDSLPVLGNATRHPNVLYAFGHQHLGMTLGPLTGQIVADLVARRDPGIDLSPYRPDRW